MNFKCVTVCIRIRCNASQSTLRKVCRRPRSLMDFSGEILCELENSLDFVFVSVWSASSLISILLRRQIGAGVLHFCAPSFTAVRRQKRVTQSVTDTDIGYSCHISIHWTDTADTVPLWFSAAKGHQRACVGCLPSVIWKWNDYRNRSPSLKRCPIKNYIGCFRGP